MKPQREYASFGVELARGESKGNRLTGYASVFNYPIQTLETVLYGTTTYIRQGAFAKTLNDNAPKEPGGAWGEIQSLFNHGHDPRFGELPIGRVVEMHEDAHGLWTEVELHDGPDNANLKAALASGSLRSMSIAFESIHDAYSDDRSTRDITEARLFEFGPVTFPANAAATAALHSMSWPGVTYIPTTNGTSTTSTWTYTNAPEQHWDGAAAMRSCSTAGDFRKIAFERANDSDPDTAAHWALPHHPNPDGAPGNADAQGVAAALGALAGARGGAPNLKDAGAARSHLEAHRNAESGADRTADEAATTPPGAGGTSEAAALTPLDVARARVTLHAEDTRLLNERVKRWAPHKS